MKYLPMILLLLIPISVFPQSMSSDCGCNAALAKDLITIVSTSNERVQYAFLNIIDEKLFLEAKSNASLFASIPIADVLVKASATYSDFETKRREYFQKQEINYTSTKEQSYQEVQVVSTAVQYQEWGKCMKNCFQSKPDHIFAWKEQEDKDSVTVKIHWVSPSSATGAAKLTSSLIGGSVTGAPSNKLFPINEKIEINGDKTVIITRVPGKTIKAVVSVPGRSDSIWSAWDDNTGSNNATLVLERPTTVYTKITPDTCRFSAWTDNNSEVDCNGGPCSPDGKWRATLRAVNITAPTGFILRNARFTHCYSKCYGFGCFITNNFDCPDGSGGKCYEGGWCGWSGIDQNNIINEVSATGVFRAWSYPIMQEYCAELWKVDNQTAKDERAFGLPSKGHSFIFEVPFGYSSATLKYKIEGQDGVINPGNQQSADGLLQLIFSTTSSGTKYYQYKIVN
ncbi:MAG TPA: hypothetical protein VIL74_07295 [Pyrinomonadaceae bacterium]|jgi:hypothetical protein